MKKITNIFAFLLVTSILVGCTPQGYRLDGRPRANTDGNVLKQEIKTPYKGDGGVIIARTDTIGKTSALSRDANLPDCAGALGLGVTVESSLAEKSYLFDKDGNPCNEAKVIFNGRDKIHQRATAQNIGITFIDALGPLPAQEQQVLDIAMPVNVDGSLPENYAIAPGQLLLDDNQAVYDSGPDRLEKAVSNWSEGYEKERVMRESEKLLADIRNINRLSSTQLLDAHQREILKLTAQLRSAQQHAQIQGNRHQSLVNKLQRTQGRADSAMMEYDQESGKLTNDVEQLRNRLVQMESASQRVKQSYVAREDTYKKQIHELSDDLRMAETQASHSRQTIVMEAAKKIAEAERLAYAARIAEKDAMEREATRLKREADTLMHRAVDLGKGRQIILPGMDNVPDFKRDGYRKRYNNDENALAPLESLNVVLREEDKSLEDIFKVALKNIEPKAGTWRVAWELSVDNMGIPLEEWSVVAEARFDEFLAYVVGKVQETHGVQLKFERFDQNKLFVISD
jgi:hypothetical protein